MSENAPHTLSSCSGLSRASTTSVVAGKDIDGRVKPGHDGRGGRRLRKVLIGIAAALVVLPAAFATWVHSLGPLPLDDARRVSTTIVDRNGKLLRAFAMAD